MEEQQQKSEVRLNTYQWTCWWGGVGMGPNPPEIHQKLLAIRSSVGGLKATKEPNGPNFAVRKATTLMAKLRTALDKEKCHVYVVDQSVDVTTPNDIPPDAKGRVLRSAATIRTKVRVCAPDGSFIEAVGTGGGGDADDKAAGKASTYSYKDALIKSLTLPDADIVDTDDESDVGVVPAPSLLLTAFLDDLKTADKAAIKVMVATAKKEMPLHEQRVFGDAVKARLAEPA